MEKKVMTKKGHQIFGQEKCTPAPRENPGYAYDHGYGRSKLRADIAIFFSRPVMRQQVYNTTKTKQGRNFTTHLSYSTLLLKVILSVRPSVRLLHS